MNDLDLLRDSWDSPAGPPAGPRASARTALLERAAEARANAASAAGRDTGPSVRRPGLGARRTRPAGWSSRLGVRLAAVGVLATAIATGITVVQTSGGDRPVVPGLPPAPVANAAQTLERAAAAAERHRFTAPRPDQWIYTAFKNVRPDFTPEPGKRQPQGDVISERQWHSADGRHIAFMWEGKMLRMNEGPPPGRSKAVRPDWPPADYAGLAALPTDPAALLEVMRRHPSFTDRTKIPVAVTSVSFGKRADDGTVFRALNSILRLGVLPPRLEAAIYRAMKMIPGVTLVRRSDAVPGRDVLAVGRLRAAYTTTKPGWVIDQVLLDPRTYRYLGELSVPALDRAAPDCDKVACDPRSLGVNALLVRSAIVDKAGQRPR
ncbi:CU044_5270 family protein [Actinomadura fulvescens]|uniref:CU044_5270 family protein n=1 Tax=Actinomadura fulvescens TaxID=46160 RepID=A0ABN3P7G2_9ACTN